MDASDKRGHDDDREPARFGFAPAAKNHGIPRKKILTLDSRQTDTHRFL
jgi:hypothetical protein